MTDSQEEIMQEARINTTEAMKPFIEEAKNIVRVWVGILNCEPEDEDEVIAILAGSLIRATERERQRCAEVARRHQGYDDELQRSVGCQTAGERIAAAILGGSHGL